MHLNRRFAALAALVVFGGGALFSFAGSATSARAAGGTQGAARVSIPVFRGDLSDGSNVSVSNWGSGFAEAARQPVRTGAGSIRVITQGMYQGARLDFKQPLDLSAALNNKNTYMRFYVRFTGQNASTQTYDPSGLTPVRVASAPFQRMRFLLVMEDGTRYELVRPVEVPPTDDIDRWDPIAFPIAAIARQVAAGKPAPTGAGARLKQIAIFGDKFEQFYIGEIEVLTDETELSVAPLDDQIFFALQPSLFTGFAEGGASTLKYSWDFDARDGIQEDAIGRTVTHVFQRVGGDTGQQKYTITLTVSDVDGIKKPVSTTLEAEVTD